MITNFKNIRLFGFLVAILFIIASCSITSQEDFLGLSTISASSPDISISADDFDNINGVETDATYTYTLTLSEAQISNIKIQVFQSGGTATEGEDFVLGEHEIIIPAYEMSAQGSITIIADTDPEDQETLSITIGDNTTANTTFEPMTYNFVLDNFVSDVLDISFAFDEDLTSGGDGPYSSCTYGLDPDIFVSDAEGFDINDPWATFNGTDFAATGDCPELLTMDKADWGDGEYVLWHEIWANANSPFWDPQLIPITASFVRAGAYKVTVVQDVSQAIDVTLPGVADAGYAGTVVHGAIAIVKIEGDVYTIKDFEGNELISGKMANGKMKATRPAGLNKTTSSGLMLN